jgi:hypothetical protein
MVGTYIPPELSLLLRSDLEEIITEKFAEHYSVNINNWIIPDLYYNQSLKKLIYNKKPANGMYCLLGKINYGSPDKRSKHTVFQFNLASINLAETVWADSFLPYPNITGEVKENLYFPLFKVGPYSKYKRYFDIYHSELNASFTLDALKDKINYMQFRDPDKDVVKIRIYKLRLALQRMIDLEKV